MKYVFTLVLSCLMGSLFAQYQMNTVPRESKKHHKSIEFGDTKISVEYSAPKVKGRKVFYELVKLDEMWRAGANEATIFETSQDLIIDEQLLPKGKYSLFILTDEIGEWEVVFNSEWKQWGAFKYDADKDIVRAVFEVNENAGHTETLDYSFLETTTDATIMLLSWGNVEFPILIETNYLDRFVNDLEARAAELDDAQKAVILIQGAEYLVEQNERLDLAANWVSQSTELLNAIDNWDERYYPLHYVKGHALWINAMAEYKLGNTQKSKKLFEALRAIKDDYNYYDKHEAEITDAIMSMR